MQIKKIIIYCKELCTSIKLGISLILLILIFGVIFWSLPADSWGESVGVQSFFDGLYFSVVTITTLGFGDVYPVSSICRILVCLEVVIGVLLVGFYLNAFATEQAEFVNKQSEKRNSQERKSMALARIKQNTPILIPKIDQFLMACYEVVTPIEKRKFEDIANGFEVKYCNMYQLFSQSLLMTNPFQKPLIECFFESLHNLDQELRYTLSINDLTHWPELRDCIFEIVTSLSTFEFEQAIVSARTQVLGQNKPNPKKLTDFISRTIRESQEPPVYSRGNLFNAYHALFDLNR